MTICQEIEFDNDLCQSEIFDRNGTCYTAPECQIKGGIPAGPCAGGFGVCCVQIIRQGLK